MTLKPWREIAVPHSDVLKGTFQQAEFAADLTLVKKRAASEEYLDPVLFFQRTFITEGMRLLLDSVVRRLTGRGGDPVIRLQTAFGGGKTHTMMAVYHLANGERPASELQGIPPILDAAGVTEMPAAKHASTISRREFIREIKEVLPQALADMTSCEQGRSPVAAVDLAQAIIGPGMGVFSKYAAVLEADGTPMSVHTALTLINTYLPGDPDEFDADTRFCLTWFEENGWMAAPFGDADVLARAKGTAVDHIAAAGVVESGAGRVRLLKSGEYPVGWLPDEDKNAPTWEATHQLIRALQDKDEAGAGALLARMPDQGERIRQLAYRLYTLCERKGWAEEARAYNELIDAWSGIEQQAREIGRVGEQTTFDF